jgi:hypothetical protein
MGAVSRLRQSRQLRSFLEYIFTRCSMISQRGRSRRDHDTEYFMANSQRSSNRTMNAKPNILGGQCVGDLQETCLYLFLVYRNSRSWISFCHGMMLNALSNSTQYYLLNLAHFRSTTVGTFQFSQLVLQYCIFSCYNCATLHWYVSKMYVVN